MTKEKFQELLRRYQAGDCSEEEILKIDLWFEKIALEGHELNQLEASVSRERMRMFIRHGLRHATKSRKIKPSSTLVLKIAATLLITVLVGYLIVYRTSAPSNNIVQNNFFENVTTKKNTTAHILKIDFPDGSWAELNPNSAISYSEQWPEQKREVRLSGEAFFEVVKDTSRPFYVYGGDVVTKVLGTSFSVKATANSESIEVAVRTGKVSVYEHTNKKSAKKDEDDGVILRPNEKVEFFIKKNHWVTSLVEKPKALPQANKSVTLVFNGTPINEIVNRIEETYSIDVIIEDDRTQACAFTGDVSMMELYDMLDVICKTIGTAYEVKGTKIFITGRGCE